MPAPLESTSSPGVVAALTRNAVEGCLAWTRWPKMELYRDGDLLMTVAPFSFSLLNNVLTTTVTPKRIDETISRALKIAQARRIPILWWIGPSPEPPDLGRHLERRGFAQAFGLPGMVIDLGDAPRRTDLEGVHVEEVADDEGLRAWITAFGASFGFPASVLPAWEELHRSMGLGRQAPWRHFVAYRQGEPVACSSLFLGAGIAGIANVGTVEPARRQGLGREVTVHALHAGAAAGQRVGALFSSPVAESLYRDIGFREICRSACYAWSPR